MKAAYPWIPDLGDGRYCNPVIYADYSDPDVIRHGSDFYMVSSSFNCTPGLPILHSRDLVNWTLINHAIQNLPGERFAEVQSGCGVWAPSIRFHDGQFWIFFPMVDEGIYVTTATDPAGKWSEPYCLLAGKGLIDPCPFWDDDGKAYLVHAYAMSRSGKKEKLHLYPMSPDAKTLLGKGQIIIDAPHHPYLEGPKVHKEQGWYYILAPGGGVPTGWQVVYRSRHIEGPFEEKVVLEQGSTQVNGPHQGALIDLESGQWWFMHFQDTTLTGRVVHLQPVHWKDGWPEMGVDHDGNGVGEPVSSWKKPDVAPHSPIQIPATTDDFSSDKLALQWQWNANHRGEWFSLTDHPGSLRLYAQDYPALGLDHAAALLLQKFPAPAFSVETCMEASGLKIGEEAGVVLMGREYSALVLRRQSAAESGFELSLRVNKEIVWSQAWASSVVSLSIRIQEGGQSQYAVQLPEGKTLPIPYPVKAREGVWIGGRVGLYAARTTRTNGWAEFNGFRFGSV